MNIKRILSFSHLGLKIKETIRRFPVVFADVIIGTIAGLYVINSSGNDQILNDVSGKVLIVSIVGFFLFIASVLICEQKRISKVFANIAVTAFLAVYFFVLPENLDNFKAMHIKQILVIVFCSVILLALSPYIRKDGSGFWNFNKQLFLRLFFTFVSSATFFVGIAASLASFGYLFGVEIEDRWFQSLWAMVVGLVSTSIFMAGIPDDFSAAKKGIQYPSVIKIFSQNILLPIITLYTVLLYAYMAKIIFTGVWPEGTVAYLVLSFAFFGILTMLLLYPLRETSEKINAITRYYYAVLIAPLVLLFAAIKLRVSDYGITDARLLLFLLGFWLVCISIYFLVSKRYDIRVIFSSLLFVSLISFFAPINLFSISAKNQIGELEDVLSKNALLNGGRIQKTEDRILSAQDNEKIKSIISYLYEINRIEDVNKFFDEKIDIKEDDLNLSQENFFKAIGIDDRYKPNSNSEIFFSSEAKDDYLISGFDYFVMFDLSRRDDMKKIEFGADKNLIFSIDGLILKISQKEANGAEITIIEKNIADFLSGIYKLGNREKISPQAMMLEMSSEKGRARIHFRNLSISGAGNDLTLESADGFIFFSVGS